MERFPKLRLAYTAIVLPVAASLWRGRDERVRDATGTWRSVAYRRTADIAPAEFLAVRVALLGRRRAALRLHPLLLALSLLIFLSSLRSVVDLWRVQQFSWLDVWLLVFPLLLVWCVWYFDARVIPHHFPPETVSDAWLSRGRCPSCTYLLHLLGAEDPRRQCAECGAVWHAPPVPTPSHPPPPPAPCISAAPTPDRPR